MSCNDSENKFNAMTVSMWLTKWRGRTFIEIKVSVNLFGTNEKSALFGLNFITIYMIFLVPTPSILQVIIPVWVGD